MKTKTLLAALPLIVTGAVIAGCGSSSDDSSSRSANKTDAAFVNDMTPHHEGAIEMAKIAQTRAEHQQVRKLAAGIIDAQQSEISLMPNLTGDMHHGATTSDHMGLSSKEMGMDGDMDMLSSTKPFDRAFIDMMIPHHQGAIAMARRELASGTNATLRELASNIISAQSREIAQMRAWRKQWYGTAASDDSHHGSGMDDSMMSSD